MNLHHGVAVVLLVLGICEGLTAEYSKWNPSLLTLKSDTNSKYTLLLLL